MVTSRSGKVIHKSGHSSRPRSTYITESRGASVAKSGSVVRGRLYSPRESIKSRSSSVRLPSTRTESEIAKKSYGKVIGGDGRISTRSSIVFRHSGRSEKKDIIDSRKGLIRPVGHKDKYAWKRPADTRGSVTRVIKEKSSVSIKDSKNVHIKGDNNIYVEGNYYEAKDYKPAKHYKHYSKINHSTGHVHYLTDHKWCGCGKFHLLRWSNKSCSRIVYFKRGLSLGISYIYPDYHRKYIFVSIGGYWPNKYRYRRYYRYGCHPTVWYGSQPYEYPSVDNSVTNNYYYAADTRPASGDYYDNSYTDTYGSTYSSSYAGSYQVSVDKTNATYYNGYHDSYDNFSDSLSVEQAHQVQQAVEDAPAEETLADIYFDNAVEAFAGGDYQSATDAINKAIELAPLDEVLPFTLVQSLFAGGRQTEAAIYLRGIFDKMPRDNEILFYPRGLYADDAVLERQIQALSRKVENNPSDGDLNLLLAYHMLGTGRIDQIAAPLYKAKLHAENLVSVAIMEDLLEDARIKEQIDAESSL